MIEDASCFSRVQKLSLSREGSAERSRGDAATEAGFLVKKTKKKHKVGRDCAGERRVTSCSHNIFNTGRNYARAGEIARDAREERNYA